jgi:molybdate transport system regulatory protein
MKKLPKLAIEPRFRINCGRRFAFGPGKAALLENIEKTGSIAEAAKTMGMSYMRAWLLVKNMNGGLDQPLVETVRGGQRRGGARLTATGVRVLRLYREIERKSITATRSLRQQLIRLLGS